MVLPGTKIPPSLAKVKMEEIMKVLALNGSPRKRTSATCRLLEALLAGMQDAGAETQLIHLQDLNLQQCIGCYNCWVRTPGVCIHKDGMAGALEAMTGADLVVFGTPLYHFSMTGLMKVFLDRLLPQAEPWLIEDKSHPGLTSHPHRHRETSRAMLVSPCGFPEIEHFRPLVETFRYIAERHGWEWMGELLRPGAEALSRTALVPLFAGYLADVRRAGAAWIRDGRISDELASALARDLFPGGRAGFHQEANRHWQTLMSRYERPTSKPSQPLTEDELDIPVAVDAGDLTCKALISGMTSMFNPEAAAGIQACIEFRFSGAEPGVYYLSIADRTCRFAEGPASEPTLTIEAPSEVWKAIATGARNGRVAMMEGAYRAKGDFALLLKMDQLFNKNGVAEGAPEEITSPHGSEPAPGSDPSAKRKAGFGRELLLSVVLPVGLFAIVKQFWGATIAVAVSVVPALIFVLYAQLVERRKSILGMISSAAFILVLLGTVAAHRFGNPLLIKLAYVPVTFCLGVAFSISVAIRRPLTMYLPRPGQEHALSTEGRQNIQQSPGVLRGFSLAAIYWGAGLLVIAAKEILLAFNLSLSAFMYVNPLTTFAALALLGAGTPVLVRRLMRQSA
jgi:putative sterol carrier protein/putative NADPH-quinone reductase